MRAVVKTVWILGIIAVFLSMSWFLFASTAFFARGIDLIESTIYVISWVPALILIIVSIRAFRKKWFPKKRLTQALLPCAIIGLSAFFTHTHIYSANTYGWLTDIVHKDHTQTTADGRLEYRIEFVSLFTRRSHAHLVVIDLSAGDEMVIPVDIGTRDIVGIGVTHIANPQELAERLAAAEHWTVVWTALTPAEDDGIYILTITKRVHSRVSLGAFEINIGERTSRRIDNLPDPFSSDDVNFLDFSLRTAKAELIDIMGEPDRYENMYAGAIEDYIYHFHYDNFGIVSLVPATGNIDGSRTYTVFSIEITSENYACPRGSRVGSCYRQVIAAFLTENTPPAGIYANMRHYLYRSSDSGFTGRLVFDDDGLPSAIVYEHTLLTEDGEFSGIGYVLLYRIENNLVASIRLGLLWMH